MEAQNKRGIGPLLQTVLGDLRQGTVGFFVALALVAGGGWATGISGNQIPLWLLGLALLVLGPALALVVLAYEKRLSTSEANQAATAASASQRVQEAEARVRQTSKERDDARQLVAQASQGSFPLSFEAQAIVRSVRSLLGDLETAQQHRSFATSAQVSSYRAIVESCQERWGITSTLQASAELGTKSSIEIADLRTMLGQIEAYAIGVGNAPADT